jgi:hypothetical protein
MSKTILCGFGFDVDAVAGWLGSYGGEESPNRSPRLVKLFDGPASRRRGPFRATRSRDFPVQMQVVANAGHEIGISAPAGRAEAMNEGGIS